MTENLLQSDLKNNFCCTVKAIVCTITQTVEKARIAKCGLKIFEKSIFKM